MNTKTVLFLLLFTIVLHPLRAFTQDFEEDHEDIYVFMRIERVGAYEIGAIYSYETERLYLPVMDLFRVLQINQQSTSFYDVIHGFFLDESLPYRIDYPALQITLGQRSFPLTPADILQTPAGLYIYTGIFGPAFGLYCDFNFRSMSVVLRTDHELPAIREMRLQQMRQNIERLRGEVQVDTTLQRQYHLFRAGMVDWAVYATQYNGVNDDARLSMAFGSELLGGETNAVLNYSTRDGFDERRQQYQWRWVNNQAKLLRQVRAGKISSPAISSLYAPMLGVSATNSPSTFRRSFGEYILADFTEPGWTVELYVNNVLVDYTTSDASGFFQFDVPMIYGATEVTMKFYGPYGEERTRQQFMNIPYSFIPKGEFEYNITGGMVQDRDNTLFGRAEARYGLSRALTLGAGYEYLSNKPSIVQTITDPETEEDKQPIEIPFVSAAANLFGRLMLSGEYAHGVRSVAQLNYRLPSNIVLDANWTIYEEGQQAIRFNYLEERRAGLSFPLRLGGFRMQTRMGFRQNVYRQFSYNAADILFSTSLGRVSTSLSGYATWIDQRTPYISANLAMGIRLPYGFTLRPQAQFDVTAANVVIMKADLEKRIGRMGYLSVGYEENVRMAVRSINLNFRYDLPFVQASLATRADRQMVTTSQGIRGSMAFGSGNNYLHTDNRSMVGRGGITIIPFVDINHNGMRDAGEPMASGLNVRMNGGRTLSSKKDSLIRIVELEPYTSYLMQLDENSLENIAWRLMHKTKSIIIDPNQFKRIEIPILPMGEVSGTVYLERGGRQRTIGRVVVNFYHADGRLFTQTMSESDGYFIHMDFPPGSYYAALDPAQLERMNVTTKEDRIDFEVQADILGDIVFGLDFVLHAEETEAPEPAVTDIPEAQLPVTPTPATPVTTPVTTPTVTPVTPAPVTTDRQELGPDDTARPPAAITPADTPVVYPDTAEQELREALERRLNRAIRLFIQAQHAAIGRDLNRSMTLVDQSLSLFVTGQALALKGTLYYLGGNLSMAREYWRQAKELLPDLEIPDADAGQRTIIRE